jgi:hypothetical protein
LQNLDLLLKIICSKALITKALKIAFVVGIILNMINQGDLILSLNFEQLSFFKLLLTFTVPFCVSMYTAVSMKLKFHVGEKAFDDAKLRCTSCNSCIFIKKDQIIPFCEKCMEKTSWKISSLKDKKCQQHK